MDLEAMQEFTSCGLDHPDESEHHGVTGLHGRFENKLGELQSDACSSSDQLGFDACKMGASAHVGLAWRNGRASLGASTPKEQPHESSTNPVWCLNLEQAGSSLERSACVVPR